MQLKKTEMPVPRKLTLLILNTLIFIFMSFSPLYAYERRTAIVETVAKTGSAVVNIRTEQLIKRRTSPFFGFGDSFFEDFFNQFAQTRLFRTQSLGSGAIINENGVIVTNAHVVEKASKIYVALPEERQEREASLLGIDAVTDLAVIQLTSETALPSLDLSDEDDLLLGETVIAIGNPFGLENSVTTGVVSSPRRRLPDGDGGVSVFIQTDALINPGNSGGPLLDINGRLIGINTAIAQQAQGIGFAIPARVVRRVVEDLISFGRVRPTYSGILPGEINRALARSRGSGGVLVTEIDPNSPAEYAGVQLADVILSLDDVRTDSASEYLSLLRTYSPSSTVTLTLLREEAIIQTSLQLSELPQNYALDYFERIFGISVGHDGTGVLVTKLKKGSPASQIDMRVGDRIVEIEGLQILTINDLIHHLESNLGRLPLRLAIYRGNQGYLVELP